MTMFNPHQLEQVLLSIRRQTFRLDVLTSSPDPTVRARARAEITLLEEYRVGLFKEIGVVEL